MFNLEVLTALNLLQFGFTKAVSNQVRYSKKKRIVKCYHEMPVQPNKQALFSGALAILDHLPDALRAFLEGSLFSVKNVILHQQLYYRRKVVPKLIFSEVPYYEHFQNNSPVLHLRRTCDFFFKYKPYRLIVIMTSCLCAALVFRRTQSTLKYFFLFYKLQIGCREDMWMTCWGWSSKDVADRAMKIRSPSVFLFPLWPLCHRVAVVYSVTFCTRIFFLGSFISISIAIILISVRFITSLKEKR